MLACPVGTCRTLRLFAEPSRAFVAGFKQLPCLIGSRNCVIRRQVHHVVFPEEEFQHLLQDVGRSTDLYAGHPLSGMSPHKRGMFLKGLCKSVLTSAHPHLRLEEPILGRHLHKWPKKVRTTSTLGLVVGRQEGAMQSRQIVMVSNRKNLECDFRRGEVCRGWCPNECTL
ncbi:unnamed protein product [Symbiodinium sp. CCMP2592]|nr:unnamed protein product [Symbiodinium sp. CCMP2592]